MRKKIGWNWEKIDEHTFRVRVMDGWLVRYDFEHGKGAVSSSMEFVRDSDHGWIITEPFDPSKTYESVKKPTVDASAFSSKKKES